MTSTVTVDIAGSRMGGAARFAVELHQYLARTGRIDVHVIGTERRVDPAWLMRREMTGPFGGRRVAVNNVGFIRPGGERWTLLRNALHFLSHDERAGLPLSLRAEIAREAPVIRATAHRADVLVTPSTAMAERVTRVLPSLSGRIVVRPHPVSADSIPQAPREPAILCPVLFAPYKSMVSRITEWIAAIDGHTDPLVRLVVTAVPAEVPASMARHRRILLAGHPSHEKLRALWARSCAVYFPPTIESFGFPLAEARTYGLPVIAVDTPQNREIAGPALRGFVPGDAGSLRRATELALAGGVAPDPGPFDPLAYFDWLLGAPR